MLSKTTEYTIRALVAISMENENGRRPGFKEVAHITEAPEQYVAKILQTFTKQGYLKSIRGRGGGFFFPDEETDISLYKIIVLTEGRAYFIKCGFGFNNCDAENPCPLHHEYMKIRDNFMELAKSETIRTMAAKIERGEAVLNRLSVE
jgi:Rrf2 family protein